MNLNPLNSIGNLNSGNVPAAASKSSKENEKVIKDIVSLGELTADTPPKVSLPYANARKIGGLIGAAAGATLGMIASGPAWAVSLGVIGGILGGPIFGGIFRSLATDLSIKKDNMKDNSLMGASLSHKLKEMRDSKDLDEASLRLKLKEMGNDKDLFTNPSIRHRLKEMADNKDLFEKDASVKFKLEKMKVDLEVNLAKNVVSRQIERKKQSTQLAKEDHKDFLKYL